MDTSTAPWIKDIVPEIKKIENKWIVMVKLYFLGSFKGTVSAAVDDHHTIIENVDSVTYGCIEINISIPDDKINVW